MDAISWNRRIPIDVPRERVTATDVKKGRFGRFVSRGDVWETSGPGNMAVLLGTRGGIGLPLGMPKTCNKINTIRSLVEALAPIAITVTLTKIDSRSGRGRS